MKSCKTCRFLVTDSFISPCAYCANYSRWVENVWDAPNMKKGSKMVEQKYKTKIYLSDFGGWYVDLYCHGLETRYGYFMSFGPFTTRSLARWAQRDLKKALVTVNNIVNP